MLRRPCHTAHGTFAHFLRHFSHCLVLSRHAACIQVSTCAKMTSRACALLLVHTATALPIKDKEAELSASAKHSRVHAQYAHENLPPASYLQGWPIAPSGPCWENWGIDGPKDLVNIADPRAWMTAWSTWLLREDACLSMCASDSSCIAYEYHKQDNVCQLSSTAMAYDGHPTSGVVFCQMKKWEDL